MDMEHRAMARLQMASELSETYYEKPLLVAYSGGKDSDVCLELARRSGIRFEAVHSLTTADAPQTVRHIRKKFHDLEMQGVSCTVIHPRYKASPISLWSLIPQKLMPPTRTVRYCCSVLKETAGKKRAVVIGTRAGESQARADTPVAEKPGHTRAISQKFDFDNGDLRILEPCQTKAKINVYPIVEWLDRDVWNFLHDVKAETNPVYDLGFCRVGCIGCPMAGRNRYDEFRLWPEYENLYRKAFGRMLEARNAAGKSTIWKTADEVFRWWMEDKNLDGQLDLFGGEVGGQS